MKGRNRKTGLEEESPVFIVGYPRSGTTMLFKFLSNIHPFAPRDNDFSERFERSYSIESNFFKLFLSKKGFKGVYIDKNFPNWRILFDYKYDFFKDFLKLSNRYFIGRIILATLFHIGIYKILNKKLRQLLWNFLGGKRIFREFFTLSTCARTSGRILEKTPDFRNHIDEIFFSFPDAKIVFIYRNPFEVYASMKRLVQKGFISDDISVSEFVLEYNSLLSKMREFCVKFPKNFFSISYEKITKDPTNVNGLFTFLDISKPDFKGRRLKVKPNYNFFAPIRHSYPVRNKCKYLYLLRNDEIKYMKSELNRSVKELYDIDGFRKD